MIEGWQVKKLGEVCDVIGGGTPPKNIEEFYSGHIPWATVRDMKHEVITDTEFKITEQAVKKSSTNIIPKDNVVIATRVGLGKVCLVAMDTAINQDLRGIVPKRNNELTVGYLFQWLRSISDVIKNEGTGATVQGVKLPFIKDLLIPLPPIPEQQRIVAILDEAFDSIATAKASAEQNLKNAKELFDSYLQSVSAEDSALGNLVEIKTGKLDANAAVEGGEYPFFTCSREIYAIDHFAFDCEAVLLAGNNAVGDFNVKYYYGKFNAYQRTYVITVKNFEKAHCRYLYFQLLRSLKAFKKKSVGAGTKFLKIGMIKNLQIPLPPIDEQRSIVARLDVLSNETQRLEAIYKQKIAALDELKQSLLQKAFAGEL